MEFTIRQDAPYSMAQSPGLRRWLSFLFPIAFAFLCYFGLAVSEHVWKLAFPNRGTIWWPAGIACAIAHFFGRRAAIGVFAAEWLVAVTLMKCSVAEGFLTGIGNSLEVVLCYQLLQEIGFSKRLNFHDLKAVVVAALISPIAMLSFQSSAAAIWNWDLPGGYLFCAAAWWANDAMAIAIAVPFVCTILQLRETRKEWMPKRTEYCCFVLCQTIIAAIAFGTPTGSVFVSVVAAEFLLLALIGIRFGTQGVAISIVLYSIVLSACLILQLDPFPKSPSIAFPYVHALLFMLWLTGNTVAVILAIHERKVKKQKEDQFIEFNKKLLGGIAAVLNNQLTVANVFCELSKEKSFEADVQPLLEMLCSSTAKLRKLSQSLLESAGRGVFLAAQETIDLKEVVQSVLRNYSFGKIFTDFPESKVLVAADPRLLESAIRNVLENAYESNPKTGIDVSIVTRIVDSEELDGSWNQGCNPGVCHILRIRDDGNGISESQLPRVFEPFYSTKSPSRGLGLSIVAGILRECRAGARISSNTSAGTTVEMSFPATKL